MSVTTPGRAAPAKKSRRGRETGLDMVRSMLLILLVVFPIWFLAQPPGSDAKKIRVVDTAADITAFAQAAPGLPVPGPLPAGWRATSSTLAPGALRIGWVTAGGQYAEYDASTGPAGQFLPGATGSGTQVGTFRIGSVVWQQYRDGDGHTSLVQQRSGGTVVVGGLRETSTLEELRVLASAVGS